MEPILKRVIILFAGTHVSKKPPHPGERRLLFKIEGIYLQPEQVHAGPQLQFSQVHLGLLHLKF
jgi:hypothetical protein